MRVITLPKSDEDAATLIFDATWDALVQGDTARLEELASQSTFPNGTDSWLGSHWLSTAVEAGNPTSLAWALSKRPEINYVDNCGFTALYMALRHEVSLELASADATALTITLLDSLLDAGAEINLSSPIEGTVLHSAAWFSSPTVVRHLLARDADPFVASDDYISKTPADVAKFHKRWEVHALLRAAMGQTPSGLPRGG